MVGDDGDGEEGQRGRRRGRREGEEERGRLHGGGVMRGAREVVGDGLVLIARGNGGKWRKRWRMWRRRIRGGHEGA